MGWNAAQGVAVPSSTRRLLLSAATVETGYESDKCHIGSINTNHPAARGPSSKQEELPLPTEPPFTAFVGNLAFDLTEREIEEFFDGSEVGSVAILVLFPHFC